VLHDTTHSPAHIDGLHIAWRADLILSQCQPYGNLRDAQETRENYERALRLSVQASGVAAALTLSCQTSCADMSAAGTEWDVAAVCFYSSMLTSHEQQ
jgi:hypothetical protein